MKPFLRILAVGFTGLALISSCETQTENTSPILASNGDAIFSKYIAVGGSLTAGYTNGGLYREGQLNAFPNLIAQQAGVKFEQALFPAGQENGTGYLTTTLSNIAPVFNKVTDKLGVVSTSPFVLSKYASINNNYGVVGLRVADINKAGLGNAKTQGFNPFFERILPVSKEELSYTDFVKESSPSFFTLSLGEQDLLVYAVSGGKIAMTETSSFAINIQKLLDALVVNKAPGILTNLPNILDLPYFNFYSFAELSKNLGVTEIYITAGNGVIRAATANDKILIDAIPNVGKVNAVGQKKGFTAAYPLSNEEVLDKDEINIIAARQNDFNGILKFEAEKRSITLFDLNSLYTKIKNKTYTVNGLTFESSPLTGGFFSLDGINPTPRGSAVIANEIIKVINENYKNSLKTTIPSLDVSKFEGLKIK
ncbi:MULTISPECIES: SGNH/GDSL hydrolase family protein [Emticicia]|uniref:SGNH/GDSL hydrolase family protein n=1 Tax=Emticicia TaxID=312278 RepID=UPI0007D8B7A5|nr:MULTISPECIES: SGNH/GDSL hydrolase family protein [Emticicia]